MLPSSERFLSSRADLATVRRWRLFFLGVYSFLLLVVVMVVATHLPSPSPTQQTALDPYADTLRLEALSHLDTTRK